MTRTRGPELSREFKDWIFNHWVYKQMNPYQMANKINNSSELMSKFGKASPSGIQYHIVRIREELENTINEDALDTYIGEFIRAKEGLDQDVAALDDLIERAGDDIELELKIRRLRHETKIDKFKLLQDSALPLQVKKLKYERQKFRPKENVVKIEEKPDGSSQEGNISDNK